MARDGWKWPGMSENGRGWPEMCQVADWPTIVGLASFPPRQTLCEGYKAQRACALRFFSIISDFLMLQANKPNLLLAGIMYFFVKMNILLNRKFLCENYHLQKS